VAKAQSKKSKSAAQAAVQYASTGNGSLMGDFSAAQKVAWILLLACIGIVPVIMSNFTWTGTMLPLTYDQFDIIKVFFQRVLGFSALAAWAWHFFTKGGKVRWTPVDYLMWAFFAWVALSTIFSIHPPTSVFGKYRRFEGLLSFINYYVLYFLTMQMATKPSRVRQLAQVAFWSGVVVAGYGVLQYLGADPINWGKLPFEQLRAFSTYGNPDLLGGYIVFPLVISLALALGERKTVMRVVYWAGFLLTALCWIVALTRGAWIGGVVGLVILVIAARRLGTKLNKVDYSALGLTGVLSAIVIGRSLSNPHEVMNIGTRVTSIVEFDSGSALSRFQIWEAALNAIKDRPIFGFGPDTFRLVFPGYKTIEYVATAGYLSVADNVHNYPLQLAAGVGVVGFLLLYGVFGFAAYRSARVAFLKDGGANRLLIAGFWAACAAYVATMFFGLSVTGSTFMLWVSMAVVLTPTALARDFKAPSWGAIAAVAFMLLAAVMIIFNVNFMRADRAYLESRVMAQGQQRIDLTKEAVRLNPWNDMYRAEVGLAYYDQFIQFATQYEQQRTSGQVDPALQQQVEAALLAAETSLKETIDFVPPEYDNYVFLSNLYNSAASLIGADYAQKALDVAKRGIEVEEYGPAIRVQAARAYLSMGQVEPAVKELEYAFEMDPGYKDAALILVDVYVNQTKEIDKARRVLQTMLERDPQDQSALGWMQRLEPTSTPTSSVPATTP